VNGAADANTHSYSSNQSIDMSSADLTFESQPTDDSSRPAENPSSPSQLLEITTATTDLALAADDSPADRPPPSSSVFDSAIDTAVEDSAASSTVPPVVEAPPSDIRDTAPPPATAQEAPAQQAQPEQDPASSNPATDREPPKATETGDKAASDLTLATATSATDLPQPSNHDQHPPKSPTDTKMQSGAEQDPPAASATQPRDTVMADAPPAPTKVAREREEDHVVEPSAKRAKTEDGEGASPSFSAPDAQPATQNGESAASKSDDGPITPYQAKEIVKIIKNSLRTMGGKNFRLPVAVLWPGFAEAYLARIPNPIDLSTIESKVKENKYSSIADFKADIHLLHDNALAFNGEGHTISKAAVDVRDSILAKVDALPTEPPTAPVKAPKKAAKRSTPAGDSVPRGSQARRPSRSAGTGPAAAPAQTFALDPATSTPLIRRDSTKNEGGRPKREIHPPKNKDLPYSSVRPKPRKTATELRFCEEVLNELKKPKHALFAAAFYDPVDPVALNIPNYFTIIKNPMDLSTVGKKLQSGAYQKAKEFEADIRLILSNCYKFNPPGNPVREMGKQMESLFNEKWSHKDQWIAEHAPVALSPSSSAGSDEEESEDDGEPEQPAHSNASTALSARLIEEQTKLIALIQAKKPDPALIQMQEEMVAIVQSKIEQDNAKNALSAKKASKKLKPPKAAKKPVSAKRSTASAPSKKSSNSRPRYLGTLEKETISAGLASLPDDVSASVLAMIKADKPDVDVSVFALKSTYIACTNDLSRLLMTEPWSWTLM